MESELKYIDIVEQPISMHPKKFALWLFIVTVLMVFAALTSAYIVRQAEGNWLEYELPEIFWITSGIVLLSSICIQAAYFAAKKDNFIGLRIWMVLTVQLGSVGGSGSIFCWESSWIFFICFHRIARGSFNQRCDFPDYCINFDL